MSLKRGRDWGDDGLDDYYDLAEVAEDGSFGGLGELEILGVGKRKRGSFVNIFDHEPPQKRLHAWQEMLNLPWTAGANSIADAAEGGDLSGIFFGEEDCLAEELGQQDEVFVAAAEQGSSFNLFGSSAARGKERGKESEQEEAEDGGFTTAEQVEEEEEDRCQATGDTLNEGDKGVGVADPMSENWAVRAFLFVTARILSALEQALTGEAFFGLLAIGHLAP